MNFLDEYGDKHVVSLVLSDFCVEFVCGVCCGSLVTVEKVLHFVKIRGSRNGIHCPCTAEYKHRESRCVILFYLGSFVSVCFRVVRGLIPQCCILSLDLATMECSVFVVSGMDHINSHPWTRKFTGYCI